MAHEWLRDRGLHAPARRQEGSRSLRTLGVTLLAAAASAGWAGPVPTPWNCDKGRDHAVQGRTRITVTAALSRAAAQARAEGWDLRKYAGPELCYSARDAKWTVFYDGLDPLPGNHFMVLVDERTKASRLVPGE
ncbi:hypothetical protein [Pelomonas sp. BJYL3]|uniref:hypothetical protein n=1 Tax=Pelomonas sp. BJYL3 TaxID=2976697 RepID=UPI0022B334C0|nr:hypothetical protein [Pelomonas sp. BJYL3]